jgi:hypothetical protein
MCTALKGAFNGVKHQMLDEIAGHVMRKARTIAAAISLARLFLVVKAENAKICAKQPCALLDQTQPAEHFRARDQAGLPLMRLLPALSWTVPDQYVL